jgi:hypothetical protein
VHNRKDAPGLIDKQRSMGYKATRTTRVSETKAGG